MAARKVVKNLVFAHEAVGRVEVKIKFEPDGNNFFVDVEDPCKLHFSHKDITEVEKYIRKTVDASLSVKWEPYLHVEVEMFNGKRFSNAENETHRHFAVTYTLIDIGTRPDGTKVSRPRNHKGGYWPPVPKVGVVDKGTFNDTPHEAVSSLVPDTEKNRAALDSIHMSMEALSKHLQTLLSPEKVQLTLANTRTLFALQAPKEE